MALAEPGRVCTVTDMPAPEPRREPSALAAVLERLAASLAHLGPVRFVAQEVIMLRPTDVTGPRTAHLTVECRSPRAVHQVLKAGGELEEAFSIADFTVEGATIRTLRAPRSKGSPKTGTGILIEAYRPVLGWLRDAGADDPRVQVSEWSTWLMVKGSVKGPWPRQSSRFVWTDGPTEHDLAHHLDGAGVDRNTISAGRYLSLRARARIAVQAAAKGTRHRIIRPGDEHIPAPMPAELEEIAAVVDGLAAEQDLGPDEIIEQVGLDVLERLVS